MKLTFNLDVSKQILLFGAYDLLLKHLKEELRVDIFARGSVISISSDDEARAKRAHRVLRALSAKLAGYPLTVKEIDGTIKDVLKQESPLRLDNYCGCVVPHTDGQADYIQAMMDNDLCFCFGPAGSGKTYLAVARGISMLKAKCVSRVVFVRPAVEAGEKLGYLPGDIHAKINPFMRPIFDAASDMMSPDMLQRMIYEEVVEIATIGFMRGRTFHDSIVIMDEAQNSTKEQMLMFLTRMGRNCRMIVTGDDSQTDIAGLSGFVDAAERLTDIDGIGIARLTKSDIVRHPLVEKIVEAYDRMS